jgi:hypothetical protein
MLSSGMRASLKIAAEKIATERVATDRLATAASSPERCPQAIDTGGTPTGRPDGQQLPRNFPKASEQKVTAWELAV